MSFGADGPAAFRHGTRLIRKILEGRRPKDIPIEQPTKFELVINNKAAKAMGLKIPESFLGPRFADSIRASSPSGLREQIP
jgi:putative tryptophan/tyrosine transport system substrate-binding protein